MSTDSSVNAFVQGASRVFLTPIVPLMDDKSVTEIMINAPDQIYFERRGKITKADVSFRDENAVEAAANIICQFVGKKISREAPRVDARLADGSRVHIIAPPVAKHTVICIRRFPDKPMAAEDLIRFGAINQDLLDFLRLCVQMHTNLLVSGGTGSGKTSLLNVLGRFVDSTERILVIEDTAELQIAQPHVVNIEARPPDEKGRGEVTIRNCFHSALRMRPDRVIIGEIRAGEALDLIQAMTSGHSGAMGTVHATTPRDALSRMETLCLYADTGLPLQAIRTQVASALNIIVQGARLRDGSRKITEVAEVLPLTEDNKYQVRSIMRFEFDHLDPEGKIIGQHRPTGYKPTFIENALRQGYDVNPKWFERDPNLPEAAAMTGSH